MRIIQVTPGAGAMYCGNCLRDNALVASLRRMGNDVLMVPLYLPLTLDEENQSAGTPIFFSGINVYLDQKSSLFRSAPGWLRNLLTSPKLLKMASGRAAKTRAEDLGELTLSMLQGEHGNQARDLEDFIAWVKSQPAPDIIVLSNALLLGMAQRLKSQLKCKLLCTLQGEDAFLDALPEPHRAQCWQAIEERARAVDLFVAPSHYFGDLMSRRLRLPPERVKVVYNGIRLDNYPAQPPARDDKQPVTVGYFARMCPEKGLDTLVKAFIRLRRRVQGAAIYLKVGGSCGPADEPFVQSLRDKLSQAGLKDAVTFSPNVDHAQKISFLQSCDLFSVPARSGEAFGLYVIEAMAAGAAVVQPRTAAFPEIIESTGGGVLFEPESAESLAQKLEDLIADPSLRQKLALAGHRSVHQKFTAQAMAEGMLRAFAN